MLTEKEFRKQLEELTPVVIAIIDVAVKRLCLDVGCVIETGYETEDGYVYSKDEVKYIHNHPEAVMKMTELYAKLYINKFGKLPYEIDYN
jgi:cell division ATPase FtsA